MAAAKMSRLVLLLCATILPLAAHDRTAGGPESIIVRKGSQRFSDMLLPRCALWSRRGVIWAKTYTDGARLEMRCATRHWFGIFPSYALFYIEGQGRRGCVGRCIFRSGCNAITIIERIGPHEELLEQTIWQNLDGGSNDGVVNITPGWRTGPQEPMLDEVDWEFDANQKTLTVTSKKFGYLPGYRGAHGCGADRFRGQLANTVVKKIDW